MARQISSAALRLLASRRKCRCTPFEFQPLLRSAVRRFCRTLCRLLSRRLVERIRGAQDANTKFALIIAAASARNHKLYLIVDEYDNFTNTILNEEGEAIYHAITHASGFYRDVFKKFKGNFDRILMLGVSPVALDDVTSGYNIATSITMDARFNRMLGFSETDVREMIRYYQSAGTLKADEEHLIAEMKLWYDGYCFSEEVVYTDPKMFNCDMVYLLFELLYPTRMCP